MSTRRRLRWVVATTTSIALGMIALVTSCESKSALLGDDPSSEVPNEASAADGASDDALGTPIDEDGGGTPNLPFDQCGVDGSSFFSTFDKPLANEWTGTVVSGSGFSVLIDAGAGAFGVGIDGGSSYAFQRVACISGTNQAKLSLRIDFRIALTAACAPTFDSQAARVFTLRFERLANQTIYELAVFQSEGATTTLREIADRDASTIVTHPVNLSLVSPDASDEPTFRSVRLDLDLEPPGGGTFELVVDGVPTTGALDLTQTRGNPIIQLGLDGVGAYDASTGDACQVLYDDVRVTRKN